MSGDEELRSSCAGRTCPFGWLYGAAHVADKQDPSGVPTSIDVEVTLTLRRAIPYQLGHPHREPLGPLHPVESPLFAFQTSPWSGPTAQMTSHRADRLRLEHRIEAALALVERHLPQQPSRPAVHGLPQRTAGCISHGTIQQQVKSVQIRSTPDGRLSLSFLQNPEHKTRVQRQVAVEGLVLGVFAGGGTARRASTGSGRSSSGGRGRDSLRTGPTFRTGLRRTCSGGRFRPERIQDR